VAGAIGVSTTLYGAAVLFALLLCAVLAVPAVRNFAPRPGLRPAARRDPLAAARAGVQEVPVAVEAIEDERRGRSAALSVAGPQADPPLAPKPPVQPVWRLQQRQMKELLVASRDCLKPACSSAARNPGA